MDGQILEAGTFTEKSMTARSFLLIAVLSVCDAGCTTLMCVQALAPAASGVYDLFCRPRERTGTLWRRQAIRSVSGRFVSLAYSLPRRTRTSRTRLACM
ncbi:hypothetical protein IE81DRAFT_19640 [Ceraceosorus guamensis]|uniref:Uncharacterized protein n=1 Tax=Ceraceosorus guamensis TaxID=1522189 RepID=A0A316W8Q8_9BASI|nr:hypothetical protein IE81DRAFT_19640 [Ceraceosorus guamensis]PWN44423.1 hypothetical protein IE81DRAFT_19640 [Ceraceosorus guamensis]